MKIHRFLFEKINKNWKISLKVFQMLYVVTTFYEKHFKLIWRQYFI